LRKSRELFSECSESLVNKYRVY